MIAALLQIVAAILGLFGAKKAKQAQESAQAPGVTAQKSVQQEQVIQDVALATKIRREVAADLAANPDKLRDDDGFKRRTRNP